MVGLSMGLRYATCVKGRLYIFCFFLYFFNIAVHVLLLCLYVGIVRLCSRVAFKRIRETSRWSAFPEPSFSACYSDQSPTNCTKYESNPDILRPGPQNFSRFNVWNVSPQNIHFATTWSILPPTLFSTKETHFLKNTPAILNINLINIKHSVDNVLHLAIKIVKTFFKLTLWKVLMSVKCKAAFTTTNSWLCRHQYDKWATEELNGYMYIYLIVKYYKRLQFCKI